MIRLTHGLVCESRKHTSKSPQVRRTFRHSLRDGLRLIPCSLRRSGSLSPSPVQCVSIVTRLTPASRRQDHTASSSVAIHSSRALPTSIASLNPTSVTIAKRPSGGHRMARACRDDLPDGVSEIFLREGLARWSKSAVTSLVKAVTPVWFKDRSARIGTVRSHLTRPNSTSPQRTSDQQMVPASLPLEGRSGRSKAGKRCASPLEA